MRKGKIYQQCKNFRMFKDLYGKPCKRDWIHGKSGFSHTNASNFWRPLQSLLLRYTAENAQVT